MIRVRHLLATMVVTVGTLAAPLAGATPFYSVESGSRCTTCHVEPIGWANPEARRDRRCTLDCTGCHLSPGGGGARTPSGRYYGEEVLPMFGRRPSAGADPMRFHQEGYPTQGRYSLFRGFEGWWPGSVDMHTIDDRYGTIDPDPVWQAGGDFRSMAVATNPGGEDSNFAAFPMEAQAYLAVHPLENLTAYMDLGYQGSTRDGVTGGGSGREVIDIVWLRELHLMVHDLPYGAWARAGRVTLPFGWRIPDHTAYIRDGVFDQYRQAYGAEAGVAANEWWVDAAVWRQGIDNWPGDSLPHGYGVTGQGGIRRLGVQAGLSGHAMSGLDGAADEVALGSLWALNLAPVVYLGEADWRRQVDDGRRTDAVVVFHEARLTALRGLTPKVRWEWIDPDVLVRDDQRHRIVFGAEWNIVRYLQFDLAVRQEFVADGLGASAILAQLHSWIL